MFALICNTYQSPQTYETRKQAQGAAKYYARKFGRTVTVVDVTRDHDLKVAQFITDLYNESLLSFFPAP